MPETNVPFWPQVKADEGFDTFHFTVLFDRETKVQKREMKDTA